MKTLVLLSFLIFTISSCGKTESNNNDKNKNKSESPQEVGTKKSMIAPDFTLKDTADVEHSLYDYRDKTVLVNFWATWCPPCAVEIPHLVELYRKYKEKGVVILGLSLDTDPKQIKYFMNKNQMEYPVLLGARKLIKTYAIKGIPTAYLINKDGIIVEKFIGYAAGAEKDIERLIIKLIEKEDE
ncbi:MAG: TlpA disulfide reductase family protein [candidate division WOR-3 bacterium]|jgi:peroxiredoxin